MGKFMCGISGNTWLRDKLFLCAKATSRRPLRPISTLVLMSLKSMALHDLHWILADDHELFLGAGADGSVRCLRVRGLSLESL